MVEALLADGTGRLPHPAAHESSRPGGRVGERAGAAPALADEVAAITREAAALAFAKWRTDFKRWEKAPGNPVCEVDLEIDRLLRDRLSALLPEAGWLSEETADDKTRLNHRYVWVVDPIDGTRDYIRGRTGWCVSVALIDGERPVLGVLDAPALGQVWRAAAGEGATLNAAPVRAGDRSAITGARVPTDALAKGDRDLVQVGKPNSIALRIAMVAADDADLVATFRWSAEWDVAAAVLLAREAGAAVTDALGKKLRFNQPSARAFGLLVTAPGLHDAAAARLRPQAVAALAKR